METPTTSATTLSVPTYATFGQRLLAVIIDIILIMVLQSFVIVPIMAAIGIGVASTIENPETMTEADAIGMLGPIFAAIGTIWLVSLAIQVLYFTLMESSKTQGTVGKMALGIKVTDLNGERLSFGKALIRAIGRIISGFTMLIGYLLAAFTEKKQALHDMIASTIVVKK
jgi:uncharacterized RDD family membrane protein YckC